MYFKVHNIQNKVEQSIKFRKINLLQQSTMSIAVPEASKQCKNCVGQAAAVAAAPVQEICAGLKSCTNNACPDDHYCYKNQLCLPESPPQAGGKTSIGVKGGYLN